MGVGDASSSVREAWSRTRGFEEIFWFVSSGIECSHHRGIRNTESASGDKSKPIQETFRVTSGLGAGPITIAPIYILSSHGPVTWPFTSLSRYLPLRIKWSA